MASTVVQPIFFWSHPGSHCRHGHREETVATVDTDRDTDRPDSGTGTRQDRDKNHTAAAASTLSRV